MAIPKTLATATTAVYEILSHPPPVTDRLTPSIILPPLRALSREQINKKSSYATIRFSMPVNRARGSNIWNLLLLLFFLQSTIVKLNKIHHHHRTDVVAQVFLTNLKQKHNNLHVITRTTKSRLYIQKTDFTCAIHIVLNSAIVDARLTSLGIEL